MGACASNSVFLLKGSGANVKKTKMMTSSENVGRVKKEGRFISTVSKKDVGRTSILCLFCRCWVYEVYSFIRVILRGDNKFKCHSSATQQIDIVENYSGIS